MKFINLQTTHHDEELKERMKNRYFSHHNKTKKNITYFLDMIAHFKKELGIRESNYHKANLMTPNDKSLFANFSLAISYGYLGNNAPNQRFPYSDIVFNFEMVISHRFEKNGYSWFSDGNYALSPVMNNETVIRIIKLLIEDLEREINVIQEEVELIDGSSTNPQTAHDRDSEPTGL